MSVSIEDSTWILFEIFYFGRIHLPTLFRRLLTRVGSIFHFRLSVLRVLVIFIIKIFYGLQNLSSWGTGQRSPTTTDVTLMSFDDGVEGPNLCTGIHLPWILRLLLPLQHLRLWEKKVQVRTIKPVQQVIMGFSYFRLIVQWTKSVYIFHFCQIIIIFIDDVIHVYFFVKIG